MSESIEAGRSGTVLGRYPCLRVLQQQGGAIPRFAPVRQGRNRAYVRRLNVANIDVTDALSQNHLAICHWDETYLQDGRFYVPPRQFLRELKESRQVANKGCA